MNEQNYSVWDRLFRDASTSAWEDWLVKLLSLVIIGLIGTATAYVWQRIKPKLLGVWDGKRRLERGLATVGTDSRGIWISANFPPKQPRDYAHKIQTSIPIVVVANLKGGVGKTTLAANLIGHFANKKKEKVLGIDLDFQGSLTANTLSDANRQTLLTMQSDGGLSKAAHLINDKDAQWLQLSPDQIDGVPTGKLISSYYSLAAMENRVMLEWLFGKRSNDCRYHLAEVLLDPLIQRTFDRIIIDAPPRLTTGCVQALCAATHVLIPTVLDDLSAEAVGAFADQLRIHQSLWPHLKIVGIVGTMTARMPIGDEPLAPVEVDAHAAVRAAVQEALLTASHPLRDATFLPTDCFIPDKTELSKGAGHRIVYASPSQAAAIVSVRDAFDRLGDEIDRRCKLPNKL